MSNVTYRQPTAPTGGKHPVNILHLVMGVVFLGVVSIWALIEGEVATTDDLRWLIPLPWVIAGAAGLVVIMMARDREPAVDVWVGEDWSPAAEAESVPAPDYTSDLDARLEAESAVIRSGAEPVAETESAAEVESETAAEATDPEATPER